MATPNAVRGGLRANNIVALLEHKPGPGIYSRLERAVQGLPENVRVQELPGLLKRYKDGIPGWELKAVDFDSITAGRTTVPRDELLAAVRERSPVFTTREVRLSENLPAVSFARQKVPDEIRLPALEAINREDNLGFDSPQEGLAVARAYPDWRQRWEMSDEEAAHVIRYLDYLKDQEASRTAPQAPIGGIGAETPHGTTRFHDYKPDGATNYTELVFLENNAAPEGSPPPVSWMPNIPHHWHEAYPQPWGAPQDVKNATTRDAVAHMRFAEQGDALRLLESQSDAHNRNIKAAKSGAETRPYSLEQVQSELDAKRLLLEAARQGKAAVEIASPEWVSETVGMPLEHAQHRYGKVLPSEVERAGRKLGGFRESGPATVEAPTKANWRALGQNANEAERQLNDTAVLIRQLVEQQAVQGIGDARLPDVSDRTQRALNDAVMRSRLDVDDQWLRTQRANELRDAVGNYIWERRGKPGAGSSQLFSEAHRIMPAVMKHVEDMQELDRVRTALTKQANAAYDASRQATPPSGWRGVISDEMRKNIITKGIPAAVAIGAGTGLATGGSEAEAKPILPNSDAALRAAMPWQTQRKIARLTKQVDSAYEKGDFKTAEKLDAQREQIVDDWDNRLEEMDEGDPAEEEISPDESQFDGGPSPSVEEQVRDAYRRYLNGEMEGDSEYVGGRLEPLPPGQPPGQRWVGGEWVDVTPEQSLARRVRSAVAGEGFMATGDDLNFAGGEYNPAGGRAARDAVYAAPDEQINDMARDLYQSHESIKAKLRNATPEDNVRAMQAQLRDMPAGLAAAPVMAQAQSVNERRELPTGSGGTTQDLVRGVVGDNDFSMAISPTEWQAHAQRLKTEGPSMEQQKFQRNVTEVLGQPIIRVGAAKDTGVRFIDGDDFDRITPAKFVGEYLDVYGGRMDDAARAQVLDRVAGRLSGTYLETDYMADDIVNRMMGSLKESSPQGKYAKVDPMPQEQLDALKQQHGDWAESMVTPGTAENFEALRGYELLRTTLDGEHAPVYADSMSNTMAFASGFVDGDSRRDFHELTFSPGPEGRFGRANRDFFRSRQREGEPAAFRDQDGTSRFASTGMNNVQGLLRAGGDMSTAVGRASWPLYDFFADFSRTNLGQALSGQDMDSSDWNFQQARHQAFDREQPILPTGMSREMFDWQRQGHMKDREEGLAWGATTYPNVQQAFDNITGSKTQKTWGPPAYNQYGPQFLQNTVGNIPSAGIMAASAATGGLAGLAAGAFKPAGSTVRSMINAGMGLGRGAAKGVGAAVASQAGDAPIDGFTDVAIGSTLAGPGNYLNYMGTPEQDNALLPGVDPNAMSIEELNDRRDIATQKRDDRFFEQKFQWNKKQKTPEEQAYDQWRQNQ
jgi:hypothetical protein